MSVIHKDSRRAVLPQTGRDEFWKAVRQHYAAASQRKWKQLAMLWLRVYCDWPIEQIGRAFGLNAGHVTRSLRLIRIELREHLLATPEMLEGLQETGARREPAESEVTRRAAPKASRST